MPLPSDEATPPVTNTYRVRALAHAPTLPMRSIAERTGVRSISEPSETRSPRALNAARMPRPSNASSRRLAPRGSSLPWPRAHSIQRHPASLARGDRREAAGRRPGWRAPFPAAEHELGEQKRLQRAARLRVELVDGVRGQADREPAGKRPCRKRAGERDGTSFRTPVVRLRADGSAEPRSGPANRSSARPAAVTAPMQSAVARGARRQAAATVHPTIGSRLPRWFSASGPAARTASTELTAPVCEARQDRGPSRDDEAAARPRRPTGRPGPRRSSCAARSRSRVQAESTRRAPARSDSAAGQRLPRAKPERAAISERAAPLVIPNPPPIRSENAATATSYPASSSGARSPSRSASQRSSGPGGAARSAAVSASPFPSRGPATTTAPAPRASSAVPSREPSSATMTAASGNAARRRPTRPPIRSASSRAAIRIERAGCLTQPAEWRAAGRSAAQPRPPSPSCRSARVAGGEQERHRQLSGKEVHVVHARDAADPAVVLDRRDLGARGLTPTIGTPVSLSPVRNPVMSASLWERRPSSAGSTRARASTYAPRRPRRPARRASRCAVP